MKYDTLVMILNEDVRKTYYNLIHLIIFSKLNNVNWAIITSEKNKETLTETFGYDFNFMKISDFHMKSYYYNPSINQKELICNEIEKKYENVKYLIVNELEHIVDILDVKESNDLNYIKMYHETITEIMLSTHDYVNSQIDVITEKPIIAVCITENNMWVLDMLIKNINYHKYLELFKIFVNDRKVYNQVTSLLKDNNYTILADIQVFIIEDNPMLIKLLMNRSKCIIGELNMDTYDSIMLDFKMLICSNKIDDTSCEMIKPSVYFDKKYIPNDIYFPDMKFLLNIYN